LNTSNFFRNVSALEALRPHIQEICRASVENHTEIRAWVAGCASGEQAYALAILFDEALAGEEHPPTIQVFASDIDEQALATARRGRYPATAVEDLSRERVEHYFLPSEQGYEVGRRLRDSVAFARHNLVNDAPFLRMDLVICRNLLRHFDAGQQESALKRFHFSLKKQGLLLLGEHENVHDSGNLFLPQDYHEALFRKRSEPVSSDRPFIALPATRLSTPHSRDAEALAFSEELEAANEDLRAINEELMGLNEELNTKSAEIQALNDEYTHVYDALDFPVLVFDSGYHLRRFNAAAARQFDLGLSALEQPVTRLTLPAELQILGKELAQASEQGEPSEQLIVHNDRQLQMVITLGLDSHRHAELLVVSLVDVTAYKEAERQLHISAKVFEQAGEAIVVTDSDTIIRSVNQAFTRITGYSQEEATGTKVGDLLRSGNNSEELYQTMWESLETSNFWQGELQNQRKDGELFSEWLTINRIREGDGDHFVAVFSDISQLKESQERAEYLATHDALTGLPNRSLFQDRLELAIAHARRHGGITALMFLDLDNFKNINDTLGHDVGDELLIQIANRLSAQMREMDTVARLGGDEFTIVLSETGFTGAEQVAARIVRALRLPVNVRNQKLFVSASIGLAFYPDDGENPQALTKAADTAMYRAKANGRDRFELYKPELQAQMLKQSRLESALRKALQNNNLRLVFQPKYTSGECRDMMGAEALLRWHDPDLGHMSPADFIPAAETSGLIKDIDRKVIGIAIQALSYWQANDMNPVPVAINISARSFQDEHFPDFLTGMMKQYHVPPTLIQVEITEGTLVERTSTALDNIEKLRDAGIPLSVDDFGTGYSSLSYLKRLPLAELKIDKSFVDGLGGKDKNDEAIAKAILAMAAALNLRTVAEGVETEEQQQWLSANGCDYLQGFLYSHPLEYRAFTEILKNGNRTCP